MEKNIYCKYLLEYYLLELNLLYNFVTFLHDITFWDVVRIFYGENSGNHKTHVVYRIARYDA